ncbi:hypothetical protein CU313_03620 [Prochlorococcus marinus str. MU1404]|uniref:hypothetical protein n=1 Tax=Prochlorococcus marinus TaxID=1219 RepID=UPI001ADB87C9|nr:hypothetical protein [Prochlorococcus marinus]MBO8230398.1 hypothetical protein [Prochlorococcus marinus XMU1404]MBW3072958.1 hypothetical protein [Prochlorococcus marinus str. MU1404]MCR8545265.1 hypothetical protein [Prochlorococcus marinus CUG1432]
MKTKLYLLLFPLTLLSSINPLFAKCDEDNWYKYGFHVGILVQTCDLATAKLITTKEARDELEFVFDGAKEDLLRDDYKSFTEFAYEDLKDCTKFLP